ncbi:MAG: hypothetical protein K2Q26_09110 [Bdellovibrionales bacterium]|nr:hypothetical protein [Bdellovibrionales bacterium]
MTEENIFQLVKKLEPLFIGYTAQENRLKNSNGMELIFRFGRNNKTTVSGLNAKRSHSIGCSFDKPVEKIFKNIRRRLIPAYHADFFDHKREKLERKDAEEANALKLQAIASIIGGEIGQNYGYRYSGNSSAIHAQNASVYETYSGLYEMHLTLDYMNTMKLAKYLKDSNFIEEKEN